MPGKGPPYTGLKPSGLDEGPVVPRAEKATGTGDPAEVIRFINHTVEEDLKLRFSHVMHTKKYDVNDVKAGRAFIQAYINFVVYSHHPLCERDGWRGTGARGADSRA